MKEIIPYIVAVLFTLAGVLGSTNLLIKNKINQSTYCFVLILSVFIGILVGYSDRIKEVTVGLGQMKMVLNEMKETQRDVQEREENIEKLAALMGDLITFVGATSVGFEAGEAQDEWLQIKLNTLSSLSGKRIDNPFSRFTQRLSTRRPGDEAQLKQIWEDYAKDVEAEVQKIKSR